MSKHTPAPWSVRTLVRDEKIVDCFVTANDVNGFAHNAEIMGDDEYRDGIARKLADATLISAAPELLEALNDLLNACYKASIHDELSEIIDGKLMDAAQSAIAKARGEA